MPRHDLNQASTGNFNQVEQLEKEVMYWKEQVQQLKDEVLKLYRRLEQNSYGAMEAKVPIDRDRY